MRPLSFNRHHELGSILHPTILLLAWIVFALVLPAFSLQAMLASSVMTIILMLLCGFKRAWNLVRRTRILLFVLLLLYAYTTPGTPIFHGWEQVAPSREGLIAGGLQAWHLLLMIAALASLLAYLSRQQLLAGLYTLLLPLKYLGLPVERFSVRLWLTLHFAEEHAKTKSLYARWKSALELPEKIETDIQLEVPNFTIQDAIFAVCYLGLIGSIVW